MLVLLTAVLGADASGYVINRCSCIQPGDTGYAELETALTAASLPPGYGLNGCSLYDENLSLFGCDVPDPPPYCNTGWCYVNTAACVFNSSWCQAKSQPFVTPSCRAREFLPSTLVEVPAYYSYDACGWLDTFSNIHTIPSKLTPNQFLQSSAMPSHW